MKKAKVLSLTLVLAMLIGIFSIMPSVGAVSNDPVKLIYAKPEYTDSGIAATGYVEVENIAYAKNVTIHYSFDGIDWYDCAAEYYKPTWGNREAWKFTTPGKHPEYRDSVTVHFAIKYEVNGQTYWDNNDKQNYSITGGYYTYKCFDFGVGGLAYESSYIYDGAVHGYLQLKDLAYEKDVKVIYTTNNWATTNEVQAEYIRTSGVNNYVQQWGFAIPTDSTDLKYKLSYTVNGVTYVDDNFGEYYTSTIV